MRFASFAGIFTLTILMFGSSLASAESVTYDFTGTIEQTAGTFTSIPMGSAVTGSFVFDLAAATPNPPTALQNPVGSPQGWVLETNPINGMTPSSVIYYQSISVNGTTYSSGPLSSSTSAVIEGLDNNILALEGAISGSDTLLQSSISLAALVGGPDAYLSNGLPNLDAINLGGSHGFFLALGESSPSMYASFGYTLTSLDAASPVPPGGAPVFPLPTPLPPGLLLLVSGLGVLALGRWHFQFGGRGDGGGLDGCGSEGESCPLLAGVGPGLVVVER
jgi:hypothetical protein